MGRKPTLYRKVSVGSSLQEMVVGGIVIQETVNVVHHAPITNLPGL
ncbi:hypothetical protein [Fischerella thermalis]|nr:hypothetical protein [Fischerella thermalis]